MIYLIVISSISAVLSGVFKAICDLSEEGAYKSKSDYWTKDLSWRNKWKNGDKKQGEKFFGSSRWFVMFTDAWHLFGVLFRISFATAYLCIGMLTKVSLFYLFGALVAYIIFATTFHIFYTYKILRK